MERALTIVWMKRAKRERVWRKNDASENYSAFIVIFLSLCDFVCALWAYDTAI